MKTAVLLLLGLFPVASIAARVRVQEGQEKQKKKPSSAITRFYQTEVERLTQEIEGSWMLIGYTDPEEPPIDEQVSGFATFDQGFVTLMISVDAVEQHLFHLRPYLFYHSGAYRYRFDEQATLQFASVMSFTNDNDDRVLEREPTGMVFEYFTTLSDDLLELRDSDAVVMSFRRIKAGDFPESAIRKLDARRGGQPHWEPVGEKPEDR